MRQIIIEGERVKYLNTEVVKEVSVADFVGHIEENLPINTGILPRNCLYMKREVSAFSLGENHNKISSSYCQVLSRLKRSKDFIP